MERMNKKGQGMSLTTIILIILGLAVLVFLIFGFTSGWGNLWGTITELGGGDANVDDIKRGCSLACDTQEKDAFCDYSRTMNFGQKRNVTKTADKKREEVGSVSGTCEFMANNFTDLNINKCPGLC